VTDPKIKNMPITTWFPNVGGGLLANGWDHHAWCRADKHFKLNWAEISAQHELNSETHTS